MSQTNRALVFLSFARPSGLRDWVRDHDERWSFVVLYLGLAVGLSVFVSLFWLLVVGALHFALECGRQAHFREGRLEVLGHALWEVKLDIGLVMLALTLVLYIDVVLGLLGLQSAARAAAVTRAGARLGTRAAAWERTIRTFLITVDEMARIAYAAVTIRKNAGAARRGAGSGSGAEGAERLQAEALRAEALQAEAAAVRAAEAAGPPDPGLGWRGAWGMADRIGLALVVAGLTLMLVAPFLTAHDWGTAAATLLEELRPFPS
jgi:signal transduction histidine kinase